MKTYMTYNSDSDVWVCSNCKEEYFVLNERMKFCNYCGREITNFLKDSGNRTFKVSAIRTYYGHADFEVKAYNEEEAEAKARSIIKRGDVEFGGLESYDDVTDIELFEVTHESI